MQKGHYMLRTIISVLFISIYMSQATAMANDKMRSQQADSYKIPDKPFAKALITRASHYQDDAKKDLNYMIGEIRPIEKDRNLDEFVSSSAVSIAYIVTIEALESINKPSAFMPKSDTPKYAPLVVAYSLLILSNIHEHLLAEGIKLNIKETAVDTASLFFLYHTEKEKSENIIKGIKTFQALVNEDSANVIDWRDSIKKLIPLYVHQWTTKDTELKNHDFIPLFGSMLSTLLAAAN